MTTKRVGRIALGMTIMFALALGIACLAGCSSPSTESKAAQETRTVTDMRGRTVDIPKSVDKIIAIGCALRPVCYLQAQDMLVGVEKAEQTDTVNCAYRHVNQSLFAKLPIIGEGGSNGVTTNDEAIIKADPQLIIADSLQADEADALQKKTGIPVVCLNQPETFFDQRYYDNLTFLGDVLGKTDRAAQVVQYIKDTETDLKARAERSGKANTISAYAAGIMYRGSHGFDGTEANFQPFVACDIINVADGKGASGPFTIDPEAVLVAQPNLIFVDSSNLALVKDDYKANPALFQAFSAVQNNQVYSIIGYRFYSTNVELALADCYQVGCVAYPDTFEGINPTDKMNEITEFLLGAKLSDDLAAKGMTFTQVNLAE